MAEKSYRDTRGDESKGSQVDREVSDLIRSKSTDHQALQKLRTKYPNNQDLVDKVHDAYKDLISSLYKRARKFKQFIFDRYGGLGLTQGELMRKAKKYIKKLKLSDPEFDLFYIMATTEKGPLYALTAPSSLMAKTLGYDSFVASGKLNVKAEDQSIVEEIVNKYGETKPLHAQVILQTLTYQDCAPEALSGTFNRDKHNPYSYIHPVIAALFLPKVNVLEEQMLMSNIGYIVHRKVNEQPIMTLPDHKLYWEMIIDPNDSACTITNAVADLKNRYLLQIQLWEAVMNLRQGKYYYDNNASLVRFMQTLENCRTVVHDAPDLTYVKDEGTILRRLLAAFSLYPTYVSLNRLNGQQLLGSQFMAPSPLENSLTRVPMITLRLPHNVPGISKAVSLEEAITQVQWFIEHKNFVPKSMQIVHSNDVLFFYVGRRYQSVNFARLNVPCNFTNLPMTVTGVESVNEHPVNAPRSLNIVNDEYELRSVVAVEKTQAGGKSLIVGCTAMVIIPNEVGRWEETCLLYDPQGAGVMIDDGDKYINNKPVSVIPSDSPFSNVGGVETFEQRACRRGTIFMYKKINTIPCTGN